MSQPVAAHLDSDRYRITAQYIHKADFHKKSIQTKKFENWEMRSMQ